MRKRSIRNQNDFDVIHAHDWLTYLAGISAKRLTGKPLVIHVHATEFDRSGENVNTEVFRLEQTGMREADKVITVSNLTRNIVINKYGIDPSKVITVHNAVDFAGRNELSLSIIASKYRIPVIITFGFDTFSYLLGNSF